jgi:hypothetical protein
MVLMALLRQEEVMVSREETEKGRDAPALRRYLGDHLVLRWRPLGVEVTVLRPWEE